MKNKRQDREIGPKKTDGLITKLFAHTGGNPEDIEDQEWYLDSPDIKLTRIFSVVLILHIVAVAGILAFKMIDKAADHGGVTLAKAEKSPPEGSSFEKAVAGKVESEIAQNLDTSVPELEIAPDQYRVMAGDTLSEIAVKVGVSSDALRLANGITSPHEISPGTLLSVPEPSFISPGRVKDYDRLPEHPTKVTSSDVDRMKPVENMTSTKEITEPSALRRTIDSGVVYKVQKGDTAWGISQKFGVHHTLLMEHNGIAKPELLRDGQLLNIPSKKQ